MKNRKQAFIITTAVLFTMVLIAGSAEEIIVPRTEGRLTITGLEDYEGCYVIASGITEDDLELAAAEDINAQTEKIYGGKIINGSVTLNVWTFINWNKIEPYSGNEEDILFSFMIMRRSSFIEPFDDSSMIGEGETYPVDFHNGISSAKCDYIDEYIYF